MHVLFINARYAPEGIAGPAFTTQQLAEQLCHEGSRASVVCRTERPGVHEEVLSHVAVFRLGLDLSDARVLDDLAELLDRLRPDVIHTLFPREFPLDRVAGLAKSRGIPIVHTLLAFFLLCPRGSLMRNGRRCETQCAECRASATGQRSFAAAVDGVVGISRYMLDLHRHWGFFADTPEQRIIHDAYQAPHQAGVQAVSRPLRLGYLGRLDPLKGIELLLRTLTGVLAGRAWTLVLGGRGEPAYEEALRSGYRDDRIRFLGFASPADLLSTVDVLIIPSLWEEPFPRVLIEAYAHGVAVVGSKRGGIPEGIAEGVTGLVFDPDQPQSLGHAITALLDDGQFVAAMKQQALAVASKVYTPAAILGQYRAVYDAVIARSKAA